MAIKITENGDVRYENENDVDRTLFPNEISVEKLAEQINEINNVKLKVKSGTITLNDGTTTPSTTQIDISDCAEEGYTIKFALIHLQNYILPFVENNKGLAQTYMSYVGNDHVTIVNRVSAWSDYNYDLLLFLCKN